MSFDVAIVGYGPVGATLAHLLGLRGVRTVVIDRAPDIWPLPRAVHFDDEIMRTFQWIGLADTLLPLLRPNVGMRFVAPDGTLLLDWPRPQVESTHAWLPSWRFHQPDLERTLRGAMAARDTVTVRTGCVVDRVEDRGDRVLVHTDSGVIEAGYVVGCDGARSLLRDTIGGGLRDLGFEERWLVTDVLLARDRPDLGDHSVQHCDPDSPATYVRGPGNRRRWEIRLTGDADPDDAGVWRLLRRWITPDDAEIERSAVYTFRSVVAERWRTGRMMIAGDAAHQTPPFMGQGMCAGIRDAANLGWKLAEVVAGRADGRLLDTYQSERDPNATEFIETAVRLGRLINAADSEAALRRAMPKPGGGAQMASIYPPLGPGIGTGRQFGQPRMHDGGRFDDAHPYRAVALATPDIAAASQGLGLPVVSSADTANGDAHLASLGAGAVLLRPDRYILGTADSAAELAALAADQAARSAGIPSPASAR